MPGKLTHQRLTTEALRLGSSHHWVEIPQLVQEYCLYPDSYFSRPAETKKYNFFFEGIQFHYPPDVPYIDLYRYWRINDDGQMERVPPFKNDNFRHVEAGFQFYFHTVANCWRDGDIDEGCRYLGVLLHFLQDATFGIHALEGPGGADLFALQRLTGKAQLPHLAAIDCPEHFTGEYSAQVLGDSVAEAVAMLYAKYVRTVTDSRHCVFQLLLEPTTEDTQIEQMFGNGVGLCADAIATLEHLAGIRPACFPDTLPLTIFEPFEFPLGGGGRYRFQTLYSKNQSLSFWAHYAANLLYALPEDTFQAFTADIQFIPAAEDNLVKVELLNDNQKVEQFTLSSHSPCRKLFLTTPKGVCGWQITAPNSAGEIILHRALLRRQ